MALAQGLLPLFWPQLRGGVSPVFLGGSLALLAALAPAMWRMWIVVGSANANYFYAATLLFGAWQVHERWNQLLHPLRLLSMRNSLHAAAVQQKHGPKHVQVQTGG